MSVNQPKRLSYTRRDIQSYHDDVDLYLKHFLPRIIDTSQANSGRLYLTIVEALVDNLNFSVDQAKLESTFEQARQRKNILRLARMLGYAPKSTSAASVDLTFSMLSGVAPPGGYSIPLYTRVQTTVAPLIEFITVSAATILEDETSIVAPAVQGILITDEILAVSASGTPNQVYTLLNARTPHEFVEVRVDGVLVDSAPDFADANPDEIVYTLAFDENDFTTILFGDGDFGKAPSAGASITASYITTSGELGNSVEGAITRVVGSIASDVGATNSESASGGAASESNDSIKRNAPAAYRSFDRAVTKDDYEAKCNEVSSVYQSYARWSEGARTDIYIMPEGGGVASSYLVSQVQAKLDAKKLDGAVPIAHALAPASIIIAVNVVALSSRTAKPSVKQKVSKATIDALDYTRIKPGRGFTLSDLSGIYENIDDGKLVDYADFRVLTRVPRVVRSNLSAPDFYGRVQLTSKIGYDQYLISAVTTSQFAVSINGRPQSVLGDVGVEYETDAGEVIFTLGVTGDVLVIGDTWRFTTSKYRDNLVIDDDEFMQLEGDGDLVIAVFYPGEYDIKKQSAR